MRLVSTIGPGTEADLESSLLRSLDHPLFPAHLPSPADGDRWHTELVQKATAMLSVAGSRKRESVRLLARNLHVSERHLRNIFADTLGLSPSQFVRLDRVRSVFARLGDPLPELATRAGYYDQSHMAADFRRVMGVPPGAFRAGHWPATDSCGTFGR